MLKTEPSRLGNPATLLTVTGQTAKMQGRFEVADSLHIECEVGGEILVGGQLVIGEKGSVSADVHTVDALVQGAYTGNMVATGTVEITATGRVMGNIETDSLVISKGGFFNGNVVRSQAAASVSPAPGPEERLAVAL
jgi:cytoskeletal protein CcmA (bactofilin family)